MLKIQTFIREKELRDRLFCLSYYSDQDRVWYVSVQEEGQEQIVSKEYI